VGVWDDAFVGVCDGAFVGVCDGSSDGIFIKSKEHLPQAKGQFFFAVFFLQIFFRFFFFCLDTHVQLFLSTFLNRKSGSSAQLEGGLMEHFPHESGHHV